ncbi:GNAT family N-acetyltransferase [Photobacterium sp. GJ3]|uniref:GNAT family N-acetyltransferase n=1 Tax=Photobacterium sp. GJ3 TaxID=2829502 RepID=UPI0035303CE7
MSARFIADVERAFFVAESEQRVIASGMINVDDGMVDAIFVVPEFMGQGVAQAMLSHLEHLAREAGLPAMKLNSTLNAAAFYRHCGFEGDEISVYESPGGLQLACIPMEKSLLSTL